MHLVSRIGLAVAGLAIVVSAAPAAYADQYVRGYSRSNGTYVQPYYRSSPNGNPYDNWSTKGNVNPYTGQPGTHEPGFGRSYSAPYGGNDDEEGGGGGGWLSLPRS